MSLQEGNGYVMTIGQILSAQIIVYMGMYYDCHYITVTSLLQSF